MGLGHLTSQEVEMTTMVVDKVSQAEVFILPQRVFVKDPRALAILGRFQAGLLVQ